MNTFVCLALLVCGQQEPKGLTKEWETQKAPFAMKKKELNPEVKLGKDSIVLRNRGVALSKKEYAKDGKGSVVLSFTWKVTKGEGQYADHLAVVLRTDGEQRQQWSHELLNGVMVRFVPNDAQIQINQINGVDHKRLGTAAVGAMKLGESYKVRIIDDGQRIDVFWEDGKDAALSQNAPPTLGQAARKIALYNREPVAGTEHESQILGLKVEVKK